MVVGVPGLPTNYWARVLPVHDDPAVARVRAMQESDLEMVRAWRNHPGISRHMLTAHEIGSAEHESWFRAADADPLRRLLIFELGEAQLGFVQFRILPEAAAEWGFYLAPSAPKGTGRRLGLTALSHAFSVLGLHKVIGRALPDNNRSISFHGSLGFVLAKMQDGGSQRGRMIEFELSSQEWLSVQAID